MFIAYFLHFSGPLLMFGAVITVLLTLIVCLLLVCLIFGGGSCKKIVSPSGNTRIMTEEKIELNHIDSHGQNGGGTVPLMSPQNHHGTNNIAVTNNSAMGPKRPSPKSSRDAYKVLPTRDPDSEESDGDEDEASAMIAKKKKKVGDSCAVVSNNSNGGMNNGGRLVMNLCEENSVQKSDSDANNKGAVVAPSSSKKVLSPSPSTNNGRPVTGRKVPPPPPPQKPKNKYPDVIGGTEKFVENDFASLPHPYRNHQYDR